MSRLLQWRTILLTVGCLLISYPLATLELDEEAERQQDEEYVSVEEEVTDDAQQRDIFVPTKDWQVVKEGQHIPPGLHVKMNLQTGLKEAKLLEEENSREENGVESQGTGADQREQHSGGRKREWHYGESDRRGVVNKRTKVFSAAEVTNMLEAINNNSVDLEHLPLIASSLTSVDDEDSNTAQSSDPKTKEQRAKSTAALRDLPVSLHQEVEEMLMLSGILANESSTVEELCHALEELEFYVHQINNARDLDVIGGLVLVVRMLNHTHPNVKSLAARVIGSASQSNPPVQELALEYGSLPLLCQLIALSQPEMVQRRALFALSALLRGNARQQIDFIKQHHGLNILGTSFGERTPVVRMKAAVLLTDLLNDELTSGNANEEYLELPVLVYSEVLSSGWCANIPLLIQSDQLIMIEKGLLAMRALSGTCGFSAMSARLQALMVQIESGAGEYQELDTEYSQHLLELCRALLKDIRKQNLDL